MNSLNFSDCCFLSVPERGYRLTWEVTQYCPYSCEYCFTWSSPRRKRFESDIKVTTKKLQAFINKLDISEVLITGGEPLNILKDIIPFLSFLNHNQVTFSFSSNLYSEKLFKKLSHFRPQAINLSIDPPVTNSKKSLFKSRYKFIEKK